jgi:hypothetical protein
MKDRAADTSAENNCQETATQTDRVTEVTSHESKTKIKLRLARLRGVSFERLKTLGSDSHL